MKQLKEIYKQVTSIQVTRADMHRGPLILVNKDYSVQAELAPAAIQAISEEDKLQVLGGQELLLERNCMQQLVALLHAIKGTEEILLVSGYRSKEEQQAIYSQSLRDNGEIYTAGYVALPGCSEHQTGLAVDVGITKSQVDFIAPTFPDTGKSGEFKAIAAKYGFIQRYERGKEQVTRINCEPWHYRYVGAPHSELMKAYGLCLEEYVTLVKQYPFDSEHLRYENDKQTASIYYVKAKEAGGTELPLTPCDSYCWSGNNADGFIVTTFQSKKAEIGLA
jgi:D-alanyl-D-alanine dipeptidase/carboxypeptidase